MTVSAPGALLIRNCTVEGGHPGDNSSADPRFANPRGLDGLPGTDDDDFRLLPGSPAVDAGRMQYMHIDYLDLDGDGNTTERTPLDLNGRPRVVDNPLTLDSTLPGTPPRVDLGAYELVRPCVIIGDVDADGRVNLTDLALLLRNFGATSNAILGEGDIEQDGDVDLTDLCLLLANFGGDCL